MTRFLSAVGILTIVSFLACTSPDVKIPPERVENVQFSCVVFKGASAVEKFDGQITTKEFATWFEQGYSDGGERIETPLSATPVGALILRNGKETLVMPLCTWTIESGHKYFACQSCAIGIPPRFRVCAEFGTIDEFLEEMEQTFTKLKDDAG